MIKACLYCGNKFKKKPSDSVKYWMCKRFCTISCSKKGISYSKETNRKRRESLRKFYIDHPEAKEKLSLYQKTHPNKGMIRKGQRLSPATEFKKGITTNENHPFWKGDNVGYYALHIWIKRHWGKAYYCEFNNKHIDRKYHWANMDRKYKRNRSSWKQLCISCHYRYDEIGKKAWITRRGGNITL